MDNLIGYHATTKRNYQKIMIEGFDPVNHAYVHPNPKIKKLIWTWFTLEPQFVYGNTCIKVDITDLDCVVHKRGGFIICKEKHIDPTRIINVRFKEKIKKDVLVCQ